MSEGQRLYKKEEFTTNQIINQVNVSQYSLLIETYNDTNMKIFQENGNIYASFILDKTIFNTGLCHLLLKVFDQNYCCFIYMKFCIITIFYRKLHI